ncbi:uncharacterized protein DS421_8g249990 [Arachis hypogaea]|nr:uncharacterized protein DS421_8g249990 [Arachis hypogaea]
MAPTYKSCVAVFNKPVDRSFREIDSSCHQQNNNSGDVMIGSHHSSLKILNRLENSETILNLLPDLEVHITGSQILTIHCCNHKNKTDHSLFHSQTLSPREKSLESYDQRPSS